MFDEERKSGERERQFDERWRMGHPGGLIRISFRRMFLFYISSFSHVFCGAHRTWRFLFIMRVARKTTR